MVPVVASLAEVSDRYDALFCDLWGQKIEDRLKSGYWVGRGYSRDAHLCDECGEGLGLSWRGSRRNA